ncbi:mechanosensitive ion channel family protein [Haloplanus aerogenes]|uniref:Mechanosensitive ion channel family protein n=1 Tax=Haloplanus aerogenes TaxID=660522 RepID=A0A3M0D8K0_9EURY|nr:mechanosensitive ion channel family protein [Haloplanus aerogenes]AZH26492.1 mechanosensitive ion channel family protein [Haloplanus aerogenes]RMB18038.1 mechanosensitive ion channel-like protein [Haloplanus aerogenes]
MNGPVLQAAGSETGFVGEYLTDFGIPPSLASAIGSAAVFVVVFVALYIIGKQLFVPFVDGLLRRQGVDEHARKPLRVLSYAIVVLGGLGLGFALAGYGNILLALSTVGAAATLAIGFALQDVIKNFVAGVFIYTDQPFRTGDWIEWGGNSGFVEDIGLRVTRVRTFDNEHLTVPNSQLTDDVIKNYDRNRTLRLKFTFRIGFEDDIDDAMDHIIAAAEAEEEILEEPAPSVKLMEINEASFDLQGRIWIRDPGDSDFLGIRGRFVKDVTDRFEAAGISIPYPHRTVDGSLDTSSRVRSGFVSDD